MISILRKGEIDLREVVRRSPVADLPNAYDTLNEALWRSIEVRYGLVDGKVACIWGLIPPTLLSQTAYLWLLTTDIIAENKFLFIRHSQRYIEEALKQYPEIIGDTVISNTPAIRWLKWLGAEFGESSGLRLPFVIKAKKNG